MKQVLTWLRDNTSVALGMVAVSALIAGGFQAREVDPASYKVLAANWSKVSAPVRAEIAASVRKDGTVTRWAYAKLSREILEDRHGLVVSMDTDTLEAERAKFLKEMGR